LCSRLLEACSSGRPGDEGLPDGVRHWSRLFQALRPSDFEGLDPDEEGHNDEMVRRWVDLYLDPSKGSPQEGEAGVTPDAPEVLPAGTLLRGSATEWALGRPGRSWPTRSAPDPWQVPGQYLHKGVLLLVAECGPGQGARLVLLNGPRIGGLTDGRGVRFGGLEDCHSGNVISLPGGGPIAGRLSLPPGELHALLRRGAVAVVDGGSPEDVWSRSPALMWAAAGGGWSPWPRRPRRSRATGSGASGTAPCSASSWTAASELPSSSFVLGEGGRARQGAWRAP